MISQLFAMLIVSAFVLLSARVSIGYPLLMATGFLHFVSAHFLILGLAAAFLIACAAVVQWKWDDGTSPAADNVF
jgi:hypothetical protein